jgi:hypothetical protein
VKRFSFLMLLIFVVAFPLSAQAQGTAPYVLRSMKPISAELRGYINDWLSVSPPSDAQYYIVTYFKNKGSVTLVSLAGVNLATPESPWSLEDGGAVWLGSISVDNTTGQVSPFLEPQAHGAAHLAAPSLAAGGGSYVSFPFAAGTAAQYGPKGVHGSGDYGTSGMVAVDLVGGDNMGASSMPPAVYASDAGTVDYVCDDGVNVAVRTHNSSTGDYFLYAHMLNNSNLETGHDFGQGEFIGALKYGTFGTPGTGCGYADQGATQYHVHWMFVPASGKFQAEGCVLTISTQVWQCGDTTVRTGGSLTGGTGSGGLGTAGSHEGSGGVVVRDPTFWDYILAGFTAIINAIIAPLPSHSPFAYTYMLFNTVEIVFRLAWVLVASNINLGPLFVVAGISISIKILFGTVDVVLMIFRAVKQLVPVA